MRRALIAGFAAAVLADPAIAQPAPLKVELCSLLSSPREFVGRSVEVSGIHVGDVEISYLGDSECPSRQLVLRGTYDASRLSQLSGSRSVFRGTVRIGAGARGHGNMIWLENPVLISSTRGHAKP
jgi:hypothetical protein